MTTVQKIWINSTRNRSFNIDRKNCTLYSSGPKGAEATFGEMAEQMGLNGVVYTFAGHKLTRDKNIKSLSQEELERGDISMELLSHMLNRTYYSHGIPTVCQLKKAQTR